MAVATGTAILIGSAVSAAAGAVVANESRQTQKRIANKKLAQQRELENRRRQNQLADQKREQDLQQTQSRVAAAEGQRLRGLQLDAKGIKRRSAPSSLAQQTDRVLNEGRA